MAPFAFFNRLTNTAFHDLTTTKTLPNLRSLLGLGTKFIPTPTHSHSPSFLTKDPQQSTLPMFYRDLQLRCYFAGDEHEENMPEPDYHPKMHVRSKWTPPPWTVTDTIKGRYQCFHNAVQQAFQKRRCPSNLLPHQRRALRWLRSQNNILIVNTDKNLGPAAIETDRYIRMCLSHLNSPAVYRRMNPFTATLNAGRIRMELTAFMKDYKFAFSPAERKFLKYWYAKHSDDPFPVFYGLMKVHKTPLKIRPVVSCSGSLLYGLGIWVASKLRVVAAAQRSYFKSSFTLLQELKELELPPNAYFFTADAVAYYTSIPTTEGLQVVADYLRNHADDFANIPVEALIKALRLVIRNNIVQFGDTFYHQINGASMGTPPAPDYSIVFFAPHEDAVVDAYPDLMRFYKRFIDDALGIIVLDTPDHHHIWNHFKTAMNSFHGIKWEFEEPSKSVNFMDLTLTIQPNGRITSTLYEKELNQHLYIPPHSCHPPGVLLGLINGLVFRIFTLCTDPNDRARRTRASFLHLLHRGYSADKIRPIFHKAIQNARNYTGVPKERLTNQSMILFRLPYHPKDPSSKELQKLWRSHLNRPTTGPPLRDLPNGDHTPVGLDRMVMCYSRPRNLSEILSYRKISNHCSNPVSSYLED